MVLLVLSRVYVHVPSAAAQPSVHQSVQSVCCSVQRAWQLHNLVRGATGGAHSQLATKECTGHVWDVVVQESVKLGFALQPELPFMPSNLLVASSTAYLLRLPMRVHRPYEVNGQCSESYTCLASASLKPVPTSAWNGLCTESCGDVNSSAVAVDDSGALHNYFSAEWWAHLVYQ